MLPLWAIRGELTHHSLTAFLGFVDLTACLPVCRQWLEDALKENDPTAVQLFLVGTKKDLSVRPCLFKEDEPADVSVVCTGVRCEMFG